MFGVWQLQPGHRTRIQVHEADKVRKWKVQQQCWLWIDQQSKCVHGLVKGALVGTFHRHTSRLYAPLNRPYLERWYGWLGKTRRQKCVFGSFGGCSRRGSTYETWRKVAKRSNWSVKNDSKWSARKDYGRIFGLGSYRRQRSLFQDGFHCWSCDEFRLALWLYGRQQLRGRGRR